MNLKVISLARLLVTISGWRSRVLACTSGPNCTGSSVTISCSMCDHVAPFPNGCNNCIPATQSQTVVLNLGYEEDLACINGSKSCTAGCNTPVQLSITVYCGVNDGDSVVYRQVCCGLD
jgi:hypothetical protein